MKNPVKLTAYLLFSLTLAAMVVAPVMAQGEAPPGDTPGTPGLTISTSYPSQVVGLDEVISLKLEIEAVGEAQIVNLSMRELPKGWTATFRGAGRAVHSVYVKPGSVSRVDLKLEAASDVTAGDYNFIVEARSELAQAELPIQLTTEEKLPPSLTLTADLPVIKGSPSTTFRYNLVLKNEGDQELTVNLQGNAPSVFLLTFKVNGQEVTSFPVGGGESKRISVEAKPLAGTEAGEYPISVQATSENLQAGIDLTAQVAGQAKLTLAGLDGRLSGQANAGKATNLKLLVRNTGSAPARGIALSSTEPNGWKVSFEPAEITELAAGDFSEVTMNLTPPKDVISGDYIVSVRAKSVDNLSSSADFRITVTTSTLWGIFGIGLIAVAVAVVMLAVARFGRR